MKTKKYIVRSPQAGNFHGEIVSRNGEEVTMENVRWLWRWSGAASPAQLAMEGVKNPNGCKFPCKVGEMVIMGVKQILLCTDKANESIDSVPIWER
jgi:hypothetical protein